MTDRLLAELTEALHSMTSKEHQRRYRYPGTCSLCQPRAAAILALMPATTEAVALAALIEQGKALMDEFALHGSLSRYDYRVRTFAAALAAAGGSDG